MPFNILSTCEVEVEVDVDFVLHFEVRVSPFIKSSIVLCSVCRPAVDRSGSKISLFDDNILLLIQTCGLVTTGSRLKNNKRIGVEFHNWQQQTPRCKIRDWCRKRERNDIPSDNRK